ncbi:MAG: DUF432 domain-containing protein [Methanoregulaceae archaeon]
MFGRYEQDFTVSRNGISLAMDHASRPWAYLREGRGETVRKILTSPDDRIVINPVEPVNLPQEITRYLEIDFPPVILNPGIRKTVYLTFPVEIGVFLETPGIYTNIDVFSFVPAKFSLYGTPGAGLITRWHKSGLFEEAPSVTPLTEGIMELTLANESPGTIEISRGVFESYGMSLYYSPEHAAMKAMMSVFSPLVAETCFIREPTCGCTERAIDLFAARKFPVVQQKSFSMEYGVA